MDSFRVSGKRNPCEQQITYTLRSIMYNFMFSLYSVFLRYIDFLRSIKYIFFRQRNPQVNSGEQYFTVG
jgi:hypothetical protein